MNREKAIKVSKKDVAAKIQSEFIHDPELSDAFNLSMYKDKLGRILVINDKGSGYIWASLAAIEKIVCESENAVSMYNINNWVKNKYLVTGISAETLITLSALLKKEVKYDGNSLAEIDKYLGTKPFIDRRTFLALVYFSCEIFAAQFQGWVDWDLGSDNRSYIPVVKDDRDRVYVPYSDLLECLTEQERCSLSQSIDIERYRHNLS
ncbi:hypothetical protein SAMN05660909_02482 [Chitinophaga terrae (ex Kim and Jung 2007)]|uniref:Uncharacterized protein n=1 Tax=Chitinophaga terrae (ex Kim and Jung 2007) TaxID=408074 RepID=A0A1H4C638_9BACT|nr:hypothetical protein [Chitinophaga terrae (ex Kim and Jung 2007)]GEP92247.1 hypothetical protein CTE07_38920 [Chitinophaga terrae (ex Kim and Jung 2007)]SEA55807.1 hypothetical protein SAMN05660909_02482 [Chitinophaga terrae (ex Kim and Jung 2007)]